jgi:hypothetical protein
VIFVSADLDKQEPHRRVLAGLIKALVPEGFSVWSDAPATLEVTTFRQEEKGRWIVNLFTFWDAAPDVAVHDVTVKVDLGGKKAKAVQLAPDGEAVEFENRGGWVTFKVEKVDAFAMVVIELE